MRPARGFTLIEVLVVLAIAATLTTRVVVRFGTWQDPDDPQRILERLAARISHQCEQALFQSRPRGLRLTARGYDAWQGGPDGWQPLPQQGPDQAQSIPRSLEFALELGGYPVDLPDPGLYPSANPDPDSTRERGEPEPIRPQLICQPLGELTPFRLTLTEAQGEPWTLEGDASGRLTLPQDRP
jgi:prepilin-type N-terminal cleavage/methylation domain-containing protein